VIQAFSVLDVVDDRCDDAAFTAFLGVQRSERILEMLSTEYASRETYKICDALKPENSLLDVIESIPIVLLWRLSVSFRKADDTRDPSSQQLRGCESLISISSCQPSKPFLASSILSLSLRCSC
jgi:hypothetical protein